jgi:hypothetical protein
MSMMFRKAIGTFVLVVLGIASAVAVAALYTDYSVKAAAAGLPSGLAHIPSDYRLVFGMNVQRFVQSSVYTKLRQNTPIGSDLALFGEKTGLDPARDVTYLVGAGNGKDRGRNQGIVIVSGEFHQDAIVSYIRSKAAPQEQVYHGALLIMFPEPKAGTVQKGLGFLSSQAIALGDLESLKAAVDMSGQQNKSIIFSDTMAPLIRSIGPDEMFWFAGDAEGILTGAPANSPLAASASSIKSIVGTFNLGEAVTGKITATAVNAEGAQKLAEAVKGLIALGQLAGNQPADFKSLWSGLTVTQDAALVTLALNIPADLLAKMGQARGLRLQ